MNVWIIQIISRVLTPKATADSIQNCLMSLVLGKATQAFVEDFSSSKRLLGGWDFFPVYAIPHLLKDSTLVIGLNIVLSELLTQLYK